MPPGQRAFLDGYLADNKDDGKINVVIFLTLGLKRMALQMFRNL
jgi:hypothetical protein